MTQGRTWTPSPKIWKKNDFGNSDRYKREYRQYRIWVEAGKWDRGVGGGEADRTTPFGVADLGDRRYVPVILFTHTNAAHGIVAVLARV